MLPTVPPAGMHDHDENTHPIGPETSFNESMYVEVHDPVSGLVGFVRVANRPNEAQGERTFCFFLPDGRVAFDFRQPEGTSNEAFDSAGLRVEVKEPFARISVRFDADVHLLEDPAAMDDPRTALGAATVARAVIDLDAVAEAPAFAESFDGDGAPFAPNHYEQVMRVTGVVEIGGLRFEVSGHGLRDHSWGPRSWEAPWFYRWTHGSTDGLAFMAVHFAPSEHAEPLRGGFVWDGRTLSRVSEVSVVTDRNDRDEQARVHLTLTTADRSFRFDGTAGAPIPLRHRHGGALTRIVEAPMTWVSDDGRILLGMAEYLDQMREGRPVGIDV